MSLTKRFIDSQKSEDIIMNVISTYRSYIEKHSIAPYVYDEFENEISLIQDSLSNNDIRGAVEKTISLYEYLGENSAVDPRIKYPGPSEKFKNLVESFE